MSKQEVIDKTKNESKIKPSVLRRAAAVAVGAGVLLTGCSDKPEAQTKKPTSTELATSVPLTTTETAAPSTTQEPVGSVSPEIGSASMVERAATPEQNAEFQASATALATSVIDLYNQGIGNKNFIHTDEQSGRQYLNVINNATDNSGYYVLAVELPMNSLNPGEAMSVHLAMVQGEVDDSRTVDVDGDGFVDNRQFLYSMYLDNNSGTGWELGYEVDPSVDTSGSDPNASPVSRQTRFSQQVILRASDGAPVA